MYDSQRQFSKGTVICRQGDEGDAMYVVHTVRYFIVSITMMTPAFTRYVDL
jgi:hypothetical protein